MDQIGPNGTKGPNGQNSTKWDQDRPNPLDQCGIK